MWAFEVYGLVGSLRCWQQEAKSKVPLLLLFSIGGKECGSVWKQSYTQEASFYLVTCVGCWLDGFIKYIEWLLLVSKDAGWDPKLSKKERNVCNLML